MPEQGAALLVTTGFLFGDHPPGDTTRAYDLEFIAHARDQLQAGRVAFCASWL